MSAVFAGAVRRLERWPWVWAGLGGLALWAWVGAAAGRGMFSTMQATMQVGSFLVLVGIGQLMVVATGNGNIDLSIPQVMTLSSLVALSAMEASDDRILIGLTAGLLAGLLVGITNVVVVFGMGIPPIVATLATGLLAQSAILVRATEFKTGAPPALKDLTSGFVWEFPTMAIIAASCSIVAAVVLQRSVFGRRVFAVGQSRPATIRAGLPSTGTTAICYLVSSLMAALSGILLASFTGPTVSLGTPYLLTSVAVVVLGGSLIQGGRSTVAGLWTAMAMLNLIVTLVFVLKWNVAVRDVFQGVVIMAVLIVAGGERGQR